MRPSILFLSVFLGIFICFSINSNAQNIQKTYYVCCTYDGQIGAYPIKMYLSIDGNHVTGHYVYTKSNKSFDLSGTFTDPELTLKETYVDWGEKGSYGNEKTVESGGISLKILEKGDIAGNWQGKGKKSKTLPVTLNKTSKLTYYTSDLKTAFRNKDKKYKVDTVYNLEHISLTITNLQNDTLKTRINQKFEDNLAKYMLENHFYLLNDLPPEKLKFFGFKDSAEVFPVSGDLEEMENGSMAYEDIESASVVFADNHLISIENGSYSFTGGVHGMHALSYNNYDTKSGDSFNLSQAFKPGYKSSLNRIGEDFFRNKFKLKKDQNLHDAGYFWEDIKFYCADNYYITEAGINFVYNEYEIAPYALGVIEFSIPYKALKPIIEPNGPLGWVLRE